jgi:hypothetical protein
LNLMKRARLQSTNEVLELIGVREKGGVGGAKLCMEPFSSREFAFVAPVPRGDPEQACRRYEATRRAQCGGDRADEGDVERGHSTVLTS